MIDKKKNRQKRHRKIRARVFGSSDRPRLCVFRSLKHIYVQAIDDTKGTTLVSASDKEVSKENKTNTAFAVGELLAKKIKEKKIKNAVFDRGGYLYHGRVKALAEGIRKGGIKI